MTLLILFTNYPALCELETKHGVEVCSAYHNQNAGRIFCYFIAESKKEHLVEALSKAKFFSLLLDGSTDTGNIDDELFVVVWWETDSSDEIVRTNVMYLAVVR